MATVKRFQDLDAWRLANELKNCIYAVIERPSVRRDFKFCDQIRESARSAPRNIAEGFARYRPREFARFLSIALGSLGETQNHLIDARDQGYLDDAQWDQLTNLTSRAIGASVRLQQYLATCEDRPSSKPRTKNQEPTQNQEP
jgi:four helix bundle protein